MKSDITPREAVEYAKGLFEALDDDGFMHEMDKLVMEEQILKELCHYFSLELDVIGSKIRKASMDRACEFADAIFQTGKKTKTGRRKGPYTYEDKTFNTMDEVFSFVSENFSALCDKQREQYEQ